MAKGHAQWQDWLEDEDADQAGDYAEEDELDIRREMLAEAMEVLNEREKDILTQRRLSEKSVTLEDLSASMTSAGSVFARSRCARSRRFRTACASLRRKRVCWNRHKRPPLFTSQYLRPRFSGPPFCLVSYCVDTHFPNA